MEKRRIIVDYKNITSEQLALITDRYPEGFAPEDMISFKNSKGETVRAVPLETSDTKYLFKVSKYKSASSELLINNAIIAENSSTRPLAASNLKNHLKGLDK